MRIALGNAFMTVVTAEMLGASSGLGVLITEGTANTDVRGVFAALIVLGALGLCADRLFVRLMRRFGGRFSARTLGGRDGAATARTSSASDSCTQEKHEYGPRVRAITRIRAEGRV